MLNEDTSLKLILTPEEIQARVAELAEEISREFQGKEIVFVGILKGAFIFMSDLVRQMKTPVKVDFIRLASYGDSSQSSGQIKMTKACEIDLRECSVVVVEDIVDTGLTLSWLMDNLRRQRPRDLKICALIDKPERRKIDIDVDYVGFRIPRGFLVGYGLDYNECYRCLPGVYELNV